MKVLQPGKCRETLTYWAQLTSWITSVMQRQRLDEMFSHFCMTQKARIQFECVMERDSSFDCEKTEREKKKAGEEYISGTSLSLSLSGSVNAFCCCLCLLCSTRVDRRLLPHCLWRPSLVMRSYRLCLKCPHILSYTNTGMPTHTHIHTHTAQTEKSVQGRPQKQTHKLCLHLYRSLSLSRFNPSHFCIVASVSRSEAF